MTIGKNTFDTTFLFNDESEGRNGFGAISADNGIAQLLLILIVLIIALGASLYALFENGAGPPDTVRGTGYGWSQEFGISPTCIDDPGLRNSGFNETLRGRSPLAGELPRLRIEEFCHVPLL